LAGCSSPSGTGDGGDETPPGDPGPGLLTQRARDLVAAQTELEIVIMELMLMGASPEPGSHALIIRPPFPWMFFENHMVCAVEPASPEGCRSGESDNDPNTFFARFAPAVNVALVWTGVVGSYDETGSLLLEGVPTSWRDDLPFEPNTDAMYVVEEHAEATEIVEPDDATFQITRTATKRFAEIWPGERVSADHTDVTVGVGAPLFEGVDVHSIDYEAEYTALAAEPVTVNLSLDAAGAASGEVRVGTGLAATIAGGSSQDGTNIDFVWDGWPELPASGCVPECGARLCGLDPVCGQTCGSCDAGEACSPAGACE
jgi:hypothetical protein